MAANKRVNILVYSGPGSTPHSLRQTLFTLRALLSPNYAVHTISQTALLNEPWPPTTAALVLPGGADLPYCRALNGAGNRRITQFVRTGGVYIGLCAGAYYASSRCEFMEGHKVMEVVGERELKFFPGTKRGLAFGGFKYQTEEGARAAELEVNTKAFEGLKGLEEVPARTKSYCNGGGVFVDAVKFADKGVEVLASYTENLEVDSGEGKSAVVFCKVGDGAALLTGPHPEFAAINLDKSAHGPEFAKVVETLEGDDRQRAAFFRACLLKLGLEVNNSSQPVPSLSPIHLSSIVPGGVQDIVSQWKEILSKSPDGEALIPGEHDTFKISNLPSTLSAGLKPTPEDVLGKLSSLQLFPSESQAETSSSSNSDRIVDYDALVKSLIVQTSVPSIKDTPSWNHPLFFSSLQDYTKSRFSSTTFGKHLLYGDVVTSTNTLLEKNNSLLRTLPAGLTFTASTQVAGRGRGSNVWVSPPGSLMFSTVLWHPSEIAFSSPVVFVQYLAGMAVVKGVKTYARGYDKINVRLKWPNDIYAEDPNSSGKPSYVKIGGVLVNSSYSGSSYGLVVGVGVNVANAAPTTGLDTLARKAGLPVFAKEKLLARILTVFEDLYAKFCHEGWGRPLEDEYYGMWLHMDQTVILETEGGMKAKIKGITRDWGLLLAEELGWEDRPTGHTVALQSDSNSFDFFKGLVKRKV